jgi:hypothetical protein
VTTRIGWLCIAAPWVLLLIVVLCSCTLRIDEPDYWVVEPYQQFMLLHDFPVDNANHH